MSKTWQQISEKENLDHLQNEEKAIVVLSSSFPFQMQLHVIAERSLQLLSSTK